MLRIFFLCLSVYWALLCSLSFHSFRLLLPLLVESSTFLSIYNFYLNLPKITMLPETERRASVLVWLFLFCFLLLRKPRFFHLRNFSHFQFCINFWNAIRTTGTTTTICLSPSKIISHAVDRITERKKSEVKEKNNSNEIQKRKRRKRTLWKRKTFHCF